MGGCARAAPQRHGTTAAQPHSSSTALRGRGADVDSDAGALRGVQPPELHQERPNCSSGRRRSPLRGPLEAETRPPDPEVPPLTVSTNASTHRHRGVRTQSAVRLTVRPTTPPFPRPVSNSCRNGDLRMTITCPPHVTPFALAQRHPLAEGRTQRGTNRPALRVDNVESCEVHDCWRALRGLCAADTVR